VSTALSEVDILVNKVWHQWKVYGKFGNQRQLCWQEWTTVFAVWWRGQSTLKRRSGNIGKIHGQQAFIIEENGDCQCWHQQVADETENTHENNILTAVNFANLNKNLSSCWHGEWIVWWLSVALCCTTQGVLNYCLLCLQPSSLQGLAAHRANDFQILLKVGDSAIPWPDHLSQSDDILHEDARGKGSYLTEGFAKVLQIITIVGVVHTYSTSKGDVSPYFGLLDLTFSTSLMSLLILTINFLLWILDKIIK